VRYWISIHANVLKYIYVYEHIFMFKSSELLSMITAFFSIANQELKMRNIIFFYDNLPRTRKNYYHSPRYQISLICRMRCKYLISHYHVQWFRNKYDKQQTCTWATRVSLVMQFLWKINRVKRLQYFINYQNLVCSVFIEIIFVSIFIEHLNITNQYFSDVI